jgi:hypothetical protein
VILDLQVTATEISIEFDGLDNDLREVFVKGTRSFQLTWPRLNFTLSLILPSGGRTL